MPEPRVKELESALRAILPLAEARVDWLYDYICTHGLEGEHDTCTCRQEVDDKMAIEKAHNLLR